MLNFLREILFSSFITVGTPPVNGRAKWPKNLFGFQQKYQEAKHCSSSNLTNSGLEAWSCREILRTTQKFIQSYRVKEAFRHSV